MIRELQIRGPYPTSEQRLAVKLRTDLYWKSALSGAKVWGYVIAPCDGVILVNALAQRRIDDVFRRWHMSRSMTDEGWFHLKNVNGKRRRKR